MTKVKSNPTKDPRGGEIYNVVKDAKGHFVKGIAPNPLGRMKGNKDYKTRHYANLKRLAAEKYEDAFALLWRAMENNEGWAYQLFFKELVPKKYKDDTMLLEGKGDTMDGQIKEIIKGLTQLNELTHDEALQRLKSLGALKLSESMEETSNEVRDTKASIVEKLDKLDYLIDLKRKEEKEEEVRDDT